jgi:hypothetical protein
MTLSHGFCGIGLKPADPRMHQHQQKFLPLHPFRNCPWPSLCSSGESLYFVILFRRTFSTYTVRLAEDGNKICVNRPLATRNKDTLRPVLRSFQCQAFSYHKLSCALFSVVNNIFYYAENHATTLRVFFDDG